MRLDGAAFVTEPLVCKLVTNAIRHARGPIRLRLIRDRTLICEVSDGSDTAPHLRRARAMDEGLVLGWCGRRCGGPEEPVSSKRPCDGTAVPYLGTPP